MLARLEGLCGQAQGTLSKENVVLTEDLDQLTAAMGEAVVGICRGRSPLFCISQIEDVQTIRIALTKVLDTVVHRMVGDNHFDIVMILNLNRSQRIVEQFGSSPVHFITGYGNAELQDSNPYSLIHSLGNLARI